MVAYNSYVRRSVNLTTLVEGIRVPPMRLPRQVAFVDLPVIVRLEQADPPVFWPQPRYAIRLA